MSQAHARKAVGTLSGSSPVPPPRYGPLDDAIKHTPAHRLNPPRQYLARLGAGARRSPGARRHDKAPEPVLGGLTRMPDRGSV